MSQKTETKSRSCPTCKTQNPDKGRSFDGRRAYRIIENRDGTFESILWFKGFEDIRLPDNWYDCRGGYIFLGREIRHWDSAKAVCEQHYNRQAEN